MREVSVVVVGDSGVGKSALVIQFIQQLFIEEHDPTVVDSYRKTYTTENGKSFLFSITDTGITGYEADAINGQVFIICYSVASRYSFEAVEEYIDTIATIKKNSNVPMVIVGTKIDLEDERNVSKSEGIELGQKYGVPFFEISCREIQDVAAVFQSLLEIYLTYRKKKKKRFFFF